MPTVVVKTIPVTSPEVSMGVSSGLDPDVLSYFHLSESDLTTKEKQKIKEISDWLNLQAETQVSKWQELRSLKYKLGAPILGNSEIDHIHKYIKLKQAVQEHEQQLEEMTNETRNSV